MPRKIIPPTEAEDIPLTNTTIVPTRRVPRVLIMTPAETLAASREKKEQETMKEAQETIKNLNERAAKSKTPVLTLHISDLFKNSACTRANVNINIAELPQFFEEIEAIVKKYNVPDVEKEKEKKKNEDIDEEILTLVAENEFSTIKELFDEVRFNFPSVTYQKVNSRCKVLKIVKVSDLNGKMSLKKA